MALFVIVEWGLFAHRVIYNSVKPSLGIAMNLKWLTVVSDCLILIGLISLGSGWQGSATMTGAFPFHASAVQLTGGASGVHALLGVPSLLAGLIGMLISLVWTMLEALQKLPRG